MTKAEIVTEIAKSTGIEKASVFAIKIPTFKPAKAFKAEATK